MAAIVLAGKPQIITPPIIGPNWVGLQFRWIGWDGSIWGLSRRETGTWLMPGVRGLGFPTPTRYTKRSPALSGSRYRGHIVNERDVFWPLRIESADGSESFVELDSGFWNTMNPGMTGVWEVTGPTSEIRRLRLRYVDVEEGQDSDAVQAGWANYGISLVAEQPYWEGPEIKDDWGVDAPETFFATGATDRLLNVSSGSSVTTARFTNPGDVEAYPIWRITGPTTDVTVGLDGKLIPVPFAIPSGQELVIDTNPAALTAYMSGVNKTALLTTADFSPVPAGADVPLQITMNGTGRVYLSLTPRYYRAY